jgi:hypothetical protein
MVSRKIEIGGYEWVVKLNLYNELSFCFLRNRSRP